MTRLNNKKTAWLISILLLCFSIGFLMAAYIINSLQNNRYCKSEYDISYSGTLSSKGIFYIFLENPNLLTMSVNGELYANGNQYTINRRLYYSYTRGVIDGIPNIQSKFIRSDKFDVDNAPDEIVDNRLFGTAHGDGSKYKAQKINAQTIVIGNYFTPFYICRFES